MADVSLSEMEAALAIARRGTFRAAAVECGLSAAALSHQVAKLEASLGVRLFHRTTRSVALTEAGRLFVDRLAPALRDVQDAVEAVKAQSGSPSGTIRINAAVSAAREVLEPLALAFLRRHPLMQIDLVTEGRLVDIVAEGFDFGVRVAGLVPSDMIAVPLGFPQLYAVVASPAYLADRGTPRTPADLLGHDCIRVRLPGGTLFSWHFERDGEIVNVDVQGRVTLDEGTLARSAAREGMGLAYLHAFGIGDDVAAGTLVPVLADWMPPAEDLCLYYPGRRHLSAAMSAFIALARARARGIA